MFKKATREKLKLRAAVDGVSGSGKSVTALRFAQALGGKIAVLDTERGSARLYIGEDFGDGPINFDVVELQTFSPSKYTEAIEAAGAEGYDVLVIDSLSHAWEGKEGALDMVDKQTNKATAWKDVTPLHRRMVDAILTAPMHVIVTMRSKTEYVYQQDEKTGKVIPRKVGMAPIQRAGMEYEFGLYGSLDISHIMTVTKSRCRAVDGATEFKPGAPFMKRVIEWLDHGTEASQPVVIKRAISDEQTARVLALLTLLGQTVDWIKPGFPKQYGCLELHQLTTDQGDVLIAVLEKTAKERAAKEKAKAAPQPQAAMSAPAEPSPAPPAPPAPPANGETLHGALATEATKNGDPQLGPEDAAMIEILDLLEEVGMTDAQVSAGLQQKYKADALSALTLPQRHDLIASLNKKQAKLAAAKA